MMKLFNLILLFVKIGAFSFGGGYVMLPIIYQGIQQFGIMAADEFSRLVALSQITPGPIAVNAATYVGYQYAGILGALTATIGVSAPSFVFVLLVMAFLERFKNSGAVEAVLSGIRPATVGLLGTAVIFMAETSIFKEDIFKSASLQNIGDYIYYIPLAICILIIVLYAKWNINPIKLTLLAGLLGAASKLM